MRMARILLMLYRILEVWSTKRSRCDQHGSSFIPKYAYYKNDKDYQLTSLEYRGKTYLFLLLTKNTKKYKNPKIILIRNEVDNVLKIKSDAGKVKNLVAPLTVDECVGPLMKE